MGRQGAVHEIAGPVVMLASEAGRFVTGVDILVDGEFVFGVTERC